MFAEIDDKGKVYYNGEIISNQKNELSEEFLKKVSEVKGKIVIYISDQTEDLLDFLSNFIESIP